MVRAYEAGLVKSYAEAGEMFGVGEATFNRIYRLYRTTGSVERKPSGHRPRSVDNEWLETHAEENPEALLRERIEDWKIKSGKAVSISTMSNAMKRIGWTHKKTPTAREREREDVLKKKDAFLLQQKSLESVRLIFVDETGFRLGDSPRYGWAPRGEDAIGKHVQGSRTTMTLIGAIALDGFRGMMTVNDGTGIDVMLAYTEQVLVPNLKEGDIVIMDNLAAYHSSLVKEAIEAVGAKVLPIIPKLIPSRRRGEN